MRYQKCYTLAYIFLIAATLLAPVEYSVPLKYAFVPLALMLLFGYASGIPAQLKIRSYFLICMCWMVLTIYSTATSEVVNWSPAARSFCMLILIFALLYPLVPSAEYMMKIKYTYIALTLFAASWIVLQFLGGADRQNLNFVTGQKDVNYMAAFMLPAVYIAMRFAFLEKQRHRILCMLCVLLAGVSILLVQSRAAFVTLASLAALCLWEYAVSAKLTKQKIVLIAFVVVVAIVLAVFIWNNPAFSRLTDRASYEENVRLDIWEYALEAFYRSPLIGSGLGASNLFSQAGTNYDTHNNYIDILGDTGILGVILFVMLSIRFVWVRKGKRLHMFSFYIACMLPLGFINGLQTISFWLPALLLAHEHTLIQRENSV